MTNLKVQIWSHGAKLEEQLPAFSISTMASTREITGPIRIRQNKRWQKFLMRDFRFRLLTWWFIRSVFANDWVYLGYEFFFLTLFFKVCKCKKTSQKKSYKIIWIFNSKISLCVFILSLILIPASLTAENNLETVKLATRRESA